MILIKKLRVFYLRNPSLSFYTITNEFHHHQNHE